MSELFGKASIRYKLTGDGAERFRINSRSAAITVRDCVTPGRGNCLDSEQRQEYVLTVTAKDSYAEGLETSVPVTIRVTNTNDNAPMFTRDEYIGRIRENELAPYDPVPLQISVSFILFPMDFAWYLSVVR